MVYLSFSPSFSDLRPGSNGRPFPSEVRVAGCTTSPCSVVQGTSAEMRVDFRTTNAANTLRPAVNAVLAVGSVSYPLPSHMHNACNHLVGSRCPLAQGEDVTYNFVFPINASYPPIRVGVELSLLDHAGRTVFCSIIDVQVRRR